MHDVNDVLINGLARVLRSALGMRAGCDRAPATDAGQNDQWLGLQVFHGFFFSVKVKSFSWW